MKISPEKGSDAFKQRQPVVLKSGLYGGVLARYAAPSNQKKWQSEEVELKIPLTFLVTNSANERKLKEFSETFVMPAVKWFYDQSGRLDPSKFFQFVAAASGADTPAKQKKLFDKDQSDIEINDYVGVPITFMLEQAAAPNRKGILTMNLKSFGTADETMADAVNDAIANAVFEENDKGIKVLKSPTAVYLKMDDEEEVAPVKAPAPRAVVTAGAPNDEEDSDDLPF